MLRPKWTHHNVQQQCDQANLVDESCIYGAWYEGVCYCQEETCPGLRCPYKYRTYEMVEVDISEIINPKLEPLTKDFDNDF